MMAYPRDCINYLIIILMINIITVACQPQIPASRTSNIKLLSAIFRHGDRTPDNNGHEMYPKDPNLNNNFYPLGLGQLTHKGKNREYELGLHLREQYNEFLGDIYESKALIARSTDYDRTKMSLQLVLAGLYPPQGDLIWNKNLLWQPIPTHYLPSYADVLMIPEECPKYLEKFNNILNSTEVQEIMSDFSELMTNLTRITGKNITKSQDMYYLYHTLDAEKSLGATILDELKAYHPNGPLLEGVLLHYELINFNDDLIKLNGGVLLRKITENMKAVKENTMAEGRKLFLFSGHETNVAAILNALDVYELHVPQYSSCVVIELHEVDNSYYVKVNYFRGIPAEFKTLTIPGCEELCPFDRFIELTAPVTPTDDDLKCDKFQTALYRDKQDKILNKNFQFTLVKQFI
uniref:acid phosphatase n=1 Tax=Sclerodermus guani TaxID=380176 RepID=A0A2R4SV17_9HYME|nr:venom acid phosphatase [Sclerodermus guani]